MKKIVDSWYTKQPIAWLKPLSLLFGLLGNIRRKFYRSAKRKVYRASVPLIVVGNITVGGTGKTPLIVYLARQLIAQGFRPGIVSRGYGSKAPDYPCHVKADTPVTFSGDEALLIARNTECPVVIDANRVEAVKSLEQHYDCNVILSDDGMQHYAMARDIEIAVVDSCRLFGNGELLPAGPLREKPARLNEVDFIIFNGDCDLINPVPTYTMRLEPRHFCHIQSGDVYTMEGIKTKLAKSSLQNNNNMPHKVHAIAGIGNPTRFFSSLCDCGFDIITHIFSDHHAYSADDIRFDDGLEVVMTEKDAVKCASFAHETDWYLSVEAIIDGAFIEQLVRKLRNFSI
jgi:tetraacyldisaccharide 4'-kinase